MTSSRLLLSAFLLTLSALLFGCENRCNNGQGCPVSYVCMAVARDPQDPESGDPFAPQLYSCVWQNPYPTQGVDAGGLVITEDDAGPTDDTGEGGVP